MRYIGVTYPSLRVFKIQNCIFLICKSFHPFIMICGPTKIGYNESVNVEYGLNIYIHEGIMLTHQDTDSGLCGPIKIYNELILLGIGI